MKKLLILLMISMLVLTGCGSITNEEIEKTTNNDEEEVEEATQDTQEVEEVKKDFDYEEMKLAIASEFEALDSGVIGGIKTTENFIISDELFEGNYAIAVGEKGRKVVVFDSIIDWKKVAIYVSMDANNKIDGAQPFYSGTYEEMLSALETGKVDTYPLAGFRGDSFDHWAKR